MMNKFYNVLAFLWYPFWFVFWLVIKLNFQNTYIDLAFILSLVMIVFFLIYYIRMIISDVTENTVLRSQRVLLYCGSPGSGKTSKGLHAAVKVANQNWKYLQGRYNYYKRRLKLFNKKPGKFKSQLEDWQEVKKSYEFWNSNKDYIPCLVSNIPLKQGKKYAYILTKVHILQELSLPYRSVVFIDEIGTWFSQLSSNDKTLERLQMSDFCRLVRHFVDGHIFSTEQDSGAVDVEFRRRVHTNKAMYCQRWIMESFLLRGLCVIAEKCFPYSIEKFLKNIYMRVGFRRYQYLNEANTERTINVNLNNEKTEYELYFTPALLNYQYDSRTFKHAYLAENKIYQIEKWHTLVPTVDELRNLGYFDHYTKVLQGNKRR